MTRLSTERLKEIDFYATQFHHNSSAIDEIDWERAILELLAELREVTRERDEARDNVSWHSEWAKVASERDALRARVAQLEEEKEQFEAWLYINCVLLEGDCYDWAKKLIIRGMKSEEAQARAALYGRDEKGKGV